MERRALLQALGTGAAVAATGLTAGCATVGGKQAKVVVIGGGFAGSTAAKYIRMWSEGSVQVTMVEPNEAFWSCPISNLVLGGSKTMADITTPYDNLAKKHGVQVVRDSVTRIDPKAKTVTLAGGATLAYDRLIVSPGVDFMYEKIPGLNNAMAQAKVLHAWKAGPQTTALRQQLEAMPNGGVYALAIPGSPYRCPPGPYERACQIANYFQKAKPKSKVLILDANKDVTSKGKFFKAAWANKYPGMVEYRGSHKVMDVDVATNTLKFEFNDYVKADVLNVIPDMRAGTIARSSGLATADNRWCEVDFLTYESKAMPGVHVLGDAIAAAPKMPKSGHMANQHGKTCAAAVVAMLTGQEVPSMPIFANTCYSFLDTEEVVHVAAVYRYDAGKKTMLPVAGAGGLSAEPSKLEGTYAMAWAQNIWADMLA